MGETLGVAADPQAGRCPVAGNRTPRPPAAGRSWERRRDPDLRILRATRADHPQHARLLLLAGLSTPRAHLAGPRPVGEFSVDSPQRTADQSGRHRPPAANQRLGGTGGHGLAHGPELSARLPLTHLRPDRDAARGRSGLCLHVSLVAAGDPAPGSAGTDRAPGAEGSRRGGRGESTRTLRTLPRGLGRAALKHLHRRRGGRHRVSVPGGGSLARPVGEIDRRGARRCRPAVRRRRNWKRGPHAPAQLRHAAPAV